MLPLFYKESLIVSLLMNELSLSIETFKLQQISIVFAHECYLPQLNSQTTATGWPNMLETTHMEKQRSKNEERTINTHNVA